MKISWQPLGRRLKEGVLEWGLLVFGGNKHFRGDKKSRFGWVVELNKWAERSTYGIWGKRFKNPRAQPQHGSKKKKGEERDVSGGSSLWG